MICGIKIAKHTAYALFFVFLCIAPIFANAQEAARLLDVPSVINGSEKMTNSIRDTLSASGHIVFNNDELNAAAAEAKVKANYWDTPSLIPTVNKKLHHDALIRISHEKSGKKYILVIAIFNANTGEIVAELERKLKSKGKVSNSDLKAIARGINTVLQDIPQIEYKPTVISIVSTPTGATVERNGVSLGITPLTYTIENPEDTTEQWTLTIEGRDPVMQAISLNESNSYNVNIPAALPTEKRIGKIAGSTGRPVFLIGFNISPTIRKLNFTDHTEKGAIDLSHKTGAFPVFSFDLAFFPCSLFSDIDALQGLGIDASIGFGFLDTRLNLGKDIETSCEVQSDGSVKCNTSYVRFNIGLIYRLLLQKKDGKYNPDGMALDFRAGYKMVRYDIDTNPYYIGNDYDGFELGLRYSAPLGLSALRLALYFNADFNAGHDSLNKLLRLGSKRDSSFAVNTGLDFMYDIWKGIFVHAGYDFTWIGTKYRGTGLININDTKRLNVPTNAELGDMFHEIRLGVGYMLY